MNYISNKDRILATLRNGKKSKKTFTAAQLAEKLHTNTDGVYSSISLLRREGHKIVSTADKKTGLNRYSVA